MATLPIPPATERTSLRAQAGSARRGGRSHSLRLYTAEQRLKEVVTRYAATAPKLATWMEENLPEGFAMFSLPTAHHKRLRTSNAIERINQELKRRTRVASLFPNEASLLRLVSALLAEFSDEWETGKIYLSMENYTTQPTT